MKLIVYVLFISVVDLLPLLFLFNIKLENYYFLLNHTLCNLYNINIFKLSMFFILLQKIHILQYSSAIGTPVKTKSTKKTLFNIGNKISLIGDIFIKAVVKVAFYLITCQLYRSEDSVQ